MKPHLLTKMLIIVVMMFITITGACKAKQPNPVKPATVLVMSGGFSIVNGTFSGDTVEAFFTSPNDNQTSCFLPSLPGKRYTNTLDYINNRLILCGGGVEMPFESDDRGARRCYSLGEENDWVELTVETDGDTRALKKARICHNSWVSPSGLLLIGGRDSQETTEFVPLEKGEKHRLGFNLDHPGHSSCVIPLQATFISTGGFRTMSLVTQYKTSGESKELPRLNTGRQNHGCGWYQKGEEKVLIVAGGEDYYDGLSSTEIMTLGQNSWKFAVALPRRMEILGSSGKLQNISEFSLSSSKIGNSVYISGGPDVRSYDSTSSKMIQNHAIYVWEDNAENATWRVVGEMLVNREKHGMTAVDEDFAKKYCKH